MEPQPYLFPKIKALVHDIVPDAKVILFSSRANGTATEESDWDVLVLTQQPVDRKLKKALREKAFPLSVEAATFISLLIVQEQDWNENPSYYALQLSIATGKVVS
jgi:predicted nucleotidyltransferase